MPSKKQHIGAWGEDRATVWLEAHGYQILDRNFFARVGEIDIIARHIDSNRLCFIEVKTRRRDDGSAEQATSQTKQNKMRLAAEKYCIEKKINPEDVHISFEQVSVYQNGGETWYQLPQQ